MSMPDLALPVQSRLVTFNVVEFAEDAPKSGSITFTLPFDVVDASSGFTIAAGSRTVRLVDGRGELRLFTATTGIHSNRTSRHGDPWAIEVRKSWESQPYPIRVPEGTTPIGLAQIPVFDWRAQ